MELQRTEVRNSLAVPNGSVLETSESHYSTAFIIIATHMESAHQL
jgi:hypothetical protein